MIVDRRSWIGLLALLGLGAGSAPLAAAPVAPRTDRKRMIHHVFFWLKNPASTADRDRLIAGLQTLRAIPEIRELRIGVPAPTEDRSVVDSSYAVSELMMFDTVADQARYQDHPIHQRFVATCGDLWERVVVYDSIDV
ncbi:Dabb family protein [Sphingomonas sp. 1P08PE]|uniref:Dabb family protein n=1 Tax=Sphingomonas sp. 1P08PE TaxID=554122 RepID=UPI00399FAA93